MSKKIVVILLMLVFVLSGCGKQKAEVNHENSADNAILEEVSLVERKSEEYEKKFLNESMTQTDMNLYSKEWYLLWDDELNSLWNRLYEEIDTDSKDSLLEAQRDFIKRKEANIEASGKQVEGGSMQPQLENCTAEEMTRARCYVLAEKLAEVRGENFIIDEKIKKEIADADPSLFDVFKK